MLLIAIDHKTVSYFLAEAKEKAFVNKEKGFFAFVRDKIHSIGQAQKVLHPIRTIFQWAQYFSLKEHQRGMIAGNLKTLKKINSFFMGSSLVNKACHMCVSIELLRKKRDLTAFKVASLSVMSFLKSSFSAAIWLNRNQVIDFKTIASFLPSVLTYAQSSLQLVSSFIDLVSLAYPLIKTGEMTKNPCLIVIKLVRAVLALIKAILSILTLFVKAFMHPLLALCFTTLSIILTLPKYFLGEGIRLPIKRHPFFVKNS